MLPPVLKAEQYVRLSVRVGALLPNEFIYGGTPGGSNTQWHGLGVFYTDAYKPIRINLSYGYYDSANRTTIDITITVNSGSVHISGNSAGKIGYVLSGNKINIYIKVETLNSYSGFVAGNFESKLNISQTEPSGIVYVS